MKVKFWFLIVLLSLSILYEFSESKRVTNITAAIETLTPEQTDTSQYVFEDIQVPELSFEFSNTSGQSVDYFVFIMAQLVHFLLWLIYWSK